MEERKVHSKEYKLEVMNFRKKDCWNQIKDKRKNSQQEICSQDKKNQIILVGIKSIPAMVFINH